MFVFQTLSLVFLGFASTFKLSLSSKWIACLIFTFIALVLRYHLQFYATDEDFRNLLVSIFQLSTILIVYLSVNNRLLVVSPIVLGLVLVVYFLVGFIQIFFDASFAQELVFRGYQDLTESGRGVRSLASEPAYFANILFMISGFFMLYSHQKCLSARSSIAIQLIIFILAASLAQSAFMILLFLLSFLLSLLVYSRGIFLATTSFVLLIYSNVVGFLLRSDSRLGYLASVIVYDPSSIYEQGAMLRLLNIPISIYGGFLHGVFGAGFSSQQIVSASMPFLFGSYDFVLANRNVGGGCLELFIKIGVLSMPLIFLIISSLVSISSLKYLAPTSSVVHIGIPLAFVLSCSLFAYGTIASPVPWFLLFSCLFYSGRRINIIH